MNRMRDNIASALAQIDHSGDLDLEIHRYFMGFTDKLLPHALKLAEAVGRYLIRKIKYEEEQRKK